MFKQIKKLFTARREADELLTKVNQELYKRNAELRVRNKTLALLRKLDQISMASLGMEDMAKSIVQAIGKELGYEIVSVAMIEGNERESVLHYLAISGRSKEISDVMSNNHVWNVSMQNIKRVLKNDKSRIVEGIDSIYPEELGINIKKTTLGKKIKNSLIYPLSIGHQALGILTISSVRDLHNLSQYEQEAISGITGLISLAISKAKIYQDLQRTTQDLRKANESLAQVDKAKSEFLSIASHQLYTPLTAIKGYLSMLKEGDYGKVPKKMAPVVDIISQSSERLIELIKSLLDVSRIESGRLELAPESVDLAQMANELVTELVPNAEKKNLSLSFNAQGNLPHVVADKQRIRQVLLNTVDNAIKYTNAGKVEVAVQQNGENITFSVTDTGKGISAEEIERLFSKFTRVGGSDKYHTDGSGLGLYVARTIMREHHGDISVTSPGLGKGSTFTVRVPIEGTKDALVAGKNLTVGIKAAEVGQKA